MATFKIKQAKATYDYSSVGGAIGTITLPMAIPTGAFITRAYLKLGTTLTSSGSATVALAIGGVALLAATAYSNAVFTAATATTGVTAAATTASTALTVTIATAALTAGKFDIIVEYAY